MTHTEPHAESLESALQVLQERMGNRWSGREGAGRAEMVRVLQEALGYDKHQANEVIASLIHIDRLHYHPAGEKPSDAGEGRRPSSGRQGSAAGCLDRAWRSVSDIGRSARSTSSGVHGSQRSTLSARLFAGHPLDTIHIVGGAAEARLVRVPD